MVIGHRARPDGGAWTPMRPEHTHVTRSEHARRVERKRRWCPPSSPARRRSKRARLRFVAAGVWSSVCVPCGPGDGAVGRLSPARVRRPSGGRGRCGHVHSLRRDGDGRFSRRYGRWSSRRDSRAKLGEGRHVAPGSSGRGGDSFTLALGRRGSRAVGNGRASRRVQMFGTLTACIL